MHASISELLAVRDGEKGIAYQHVTDCQMCQLEIKRLDDIGSRLVDLPEVEVPDDSWQKIVAQRTQSTSVKPSGSLVRSIYALAASIMIVGFSAILTFKSTPETEILSDIRAESRALEKVLASFRVNNSNLTMSQEFKLEQLHWQLMVLDQKLSAPERGLNKASLENLWQERIKTMNTMLATYNNDPSALKYPVERNLL